MATRRAAKTGAVLVLVFGATAVARADAILTADDNTIASASAFQRDQDFNTIGDPQFELNFGTPGIDFNGDASTTYQEMGFFSSAAGHWERTFSPSDPGLGGGFSSVSFSGRGNAGSTSAGQWRDNIDGGGVSLLHFSVDSETAWNFSADVMGTTATSGSANAYATFGVFLVSPDFTVTFGEASLNAVDGGNINDSVNLGGVIPAGDYALAISISAGQFYEFAGGSGSAWIELSNGVFTVPEPGTAALVVLCGLALRWRCQPRRRTGAGLGPAEHRTEVK